LLYEDLSIRYAGSAPAQPGAPGGPGGPFAPALAGYSRHWLTGTEAAPTEAIAAECCLIRRAAFEAVDGFSRDYAGPDFQAADFALRLRRIGAACLWTPAVTMYALDEDAPADGEPYWMKPARRIDAWRFAAKWPGEAPTRELEGMRP
jgi:GT2 family glycosyltransferase